MLKKTLFLLCGLLSAALWSASYTSDYDPKLPRRISITKGSSLILDKNTHIVLPPKSTPTARFAAAELAKFLGRSLNAQIKIVPAPLKTGTAIAVGDNDYAKKAGINTASFDRDGFAIKSVANMIVIAGRDCKNGNPAAKNSNYFEHATLFGVYDFLERVAGVRFYFPGKFGEYVPRHEKIALGAIDIYDRPDHYQRRSSEFHNKWFDAENAKGGAVLQDYRRRSQTIYIPCCHSLENSGYYRRFAKTHPEYFAIDPQGKLYAPHHWSVGSGCYLSKGFRNEIYLDGVSYLKGEPPSKRGVMAGTDRNPAPGYRWATVVGQPGFFSVMPGDHHRRCLCDKCKAYMTKHGENEYVWDMVIDIAKRIQKEFPKAKVTGMSYARYTEVPKQKLPSNLEVMVAISGPWAENNKAVREKTDRRIRSWAKALNKKVWLWTYPGKLNENSNPGIPQMAPRTVGKYFKRQAPYTFGSYYESESDQWIFNYLNTFVYFRQAWDNSVDIDALVDEHHKLMFGKAAPEMNRFYNELERIWITQIVGRVTETPLGPVVTPPAENEMWEKLYSPANLKEFTALFDAAVKKTSGETRDRINFIKTHFLDSLKSRSEKYFREKEALADWSYYVKALAANEKITVDGQLNELAWQKADSAFLLPASGDTVEVKTIVKGRIDKEFLYFGIECMEPLMNDIKNTKRSRDHKDLWGDSVVELMLAPSGKAKEYFQFIINSRGDFADYKNTRMGNKSLNDIKWNAGAKVAAAALKDRYTVEIAIPLKSLKGFDPANFKANFCRNRALKTTKVKSPYYVWSPTPIGFHAVEKYGKLVFKPVNDGNMIKYADFPQNTLRGTWDVSSHDPAKGPVLDETTFITAGRSVKFHSPDGAHFKWLYRSLPLKANTTYAVSFYLKMDNVKPVAPHGGFQILLGDNSNNFYPPSPYTGSQPWRRMGFFWTTGKDGGKVIPGRSRCIRFGLYKASGTVWIDNLKFVEVKTAPQK